MNYIETGGHEKETVYSWLRGYNHEKNGEFMRSLEVEGTEIPIFLCARDQKREIVGGLEGSILHKWLKVDIMAVDPENRKRGVGTELVARAETIALEHGCTYSFVDTMSYQAPEFYQQLGYEIVGRIPDWDSHGHEKFYLTKSLVAAES